MMHRLIARTLTGKKAPPRKEDEAAKRGEKVMPGSSLTDNEIIARLDPRLYEEEFDAMSFVLEKLPKGLYLRSTSFWSYPFGQ